MRQYNIPGQIAGRLVDVPEPPGSKNGTFDATKLTTEVYVYKFTAGNFSETRNMILST